MGRRSVLPESVAVYDTTLRDGCQGAGISLSLRDKLDVARRLDELGVDWVEGGWPGSNPKDEQFFEAIREQPLRHARVAAFGSTRRARVLPEDDRNLRLLVDAGTPTVALVAKAWDFHVTAVLRTSLEENLAMVADSVRFLKEHGREVVLDAEHFFDGYGSGRGHAIDVLGAAADAGADWLVLCDTNGGSLPTQISDAVADVVATFDVPVGIHAHNDGELAVANTLAAVTAGARQVQGTINGYGERVGNANLCSVIPNLVLKLGVACNAADRLEELTAYSAYVDDVANVAPNPRLPFVGYAAFAHKGGIHVQAVSIDPRTYEHVDPHVVGNERRVLVGELSGRNNVAERARALGIDLAADDPVARSVAAKLKELENEGFQFEDAEASFELLVRRMLDGYRRPFVPLAYAVDARKQHDDEATMSLATVVVGVGAEVLRGEATGGGPVDALERAFRRALQPAFPHLAGVALTDFRSQIAHGRGGSRGAVRVRISGSASRRAPWTTVGSAPDLLHASWLALGDCLEYAVLTRAGAESSAVEIRPRVEPIPLAQLAPLLRGELDDSDRDLLRTLAATDWSAMTLDLADASARRVAAHATSLGAALLYSFGNFCAIAAHPERGSVVRVNLLKGRPENQVGSVTTTRDRFESLFDWSLVPEPLSRRCVLELIDAFYELGPMGFRGPAVHTLPGHLTSLDSTTRTTQLIGPGNRCPSNDLVGEALVRAGSDYLFITSANVSSGITGRIEPAHYDLRGMQEDFGNADGVVLIGHREEGSVRASYPKHLPMSTSILAFHQIATDEQGQPALVLERHGSLAADDVRDLVAGFGLGLVFGPGARERLPLRDDAPISV
jgi:2-isopropylmalate synthase